MDTEPILTKTSDLDKRFNIGKNTRVNRLAMLGLTPDRLVKQGRFYFLNLEQVELFGEFDRYILSTGSADGFPGLEQTFGETAETFEELEQTFAETSGDLFADGENELDESFEEEPEGYLVRSEAQDLAETSPVAEGEYCYPDDVYQVKASTLLMVENAQRRATALMLAENALVQQYMDDPSLLKPELRAQISNLEYREIDPKELAASLLAEAQVYVGGAA